MTHSDDYGRGRRPGGRADDLRGIGPRGSRPPSRDYQRQERYYNRGTDPRSETGETNGQYGRRRRATADTSDRYGRREDYYDYGGDPAEPGDYDDGGYPYDPREPYGTGQYEREPYGRRRTRQKPKRKPWKTVLIVLGFVTVIGLVGGVAAFAIAYAMTPVPKKNAMAEADTSIVYFADGKTEIGRFAAQNREIVKLEDVPKHVQDAVIAAENKTFWTDKGVDPIGIVRAGLSTAGGSKQGASTITQQYVKNYFLTPERTWSRKMKELFITLKVQQTTTKEEILESYLNTSFFGRGCWGIQTASKAYFGKSVGKLSVEEAAVLASMLKAPSNYDPEMNDGDTTRLNGRFRYTLRGMGELDPKLKGLDQTAKLPKILPMKTREKFKGPKGFLLMKARNELGRLGIPESDLESKGYRVTTTYDAKAQKALEKSMRENYPKKAAKGVHAGAAAIRPGTGEIVAMYGGPDYLKRQWNEATQSKLQPGSTFKPFALAAALEENISLDSRFAGNTPYWVEGKRIAPNRVKNEFNRDYGRRVTLLNAIKESINTAFVDLTMTELGTRKVVDAAVRAGVPKDSPGLRPMPKVALGFASVSPMDMANAYATFASGGLRAEPHVIKKVIRADTGEIEKEFKTPAKRVFEEDIVSNIDFALEKVITDGTGEKEAGKVDRTAAGKTGTHEDETAWFVGYTPQISAAVAFYKDADGDGVKESLDNIGGRETFFGGGYPARIWAAFMNDALKGEPEEPFPPRSKLGLVVNPKPKPKPSTPTTGPSTPMSPGPTFPTTSPGPSTGPTTPGPDPTTPGPTIPPDPDPTDPPTIGPGRGRHDASYDPGGG